MYEVKKYVFLWKDVPLPENAGRGIWNKNPYGSHRVHMSASIASEYQISYTVEYEDKSVYENDRENFDKAFSEGLAFIGNSIGYSAEELSELIEEAKYTFTKTPATFREWKKNML